MSFKNKKELAEFRAKMQEREFTDKCSTPGCGCHEFVLAHWSKEQKHATLEVECADCDVSQVLKVSRLVDQRRYFLRKLDLLDWLNERIEVLMEQIEAARSEMNHLLHCIDPECESCRDIEKGQADEYEGETLEQ